MDVETFWNGERTWARCVYVKVGPSPRETWWCAPLEGQVRPAVEVTYGGETFYLDDEDGSGWRKVTEGHGGPAYRHRSLPDGSTVVGGGWPSRSSRGSQRGVTQVSEKVRDLMAALQDSLTKASDIGSERWLRERFPKKEWHRHRRSDGGTDLCDGTPSDCPSKPRVGGDTMEPLTDHERALCYASGLFAYGECEAPDEEDERCEYDDDGAVCIRHASAWPCPHDEQAAILRGGGHSEATE